MTKKLLFVCSQNRLRSPTAESVFSAWNGVEAIACGTNADCPTPISGDLIEWADVVLVMETSHRNKVAKKFRAQLKDKRLVTLDIPDNYSLMDPKLVALLQARVPQYVSL